MFVRSAYDPAGWGPGLIKIVFEFDKEYPCVLRLNKEYPCGRFGNGDWWISAVPLCSVIVINIRPKGSGLHGAEFNLSCKFKQGFECIRGTGR